MTRSTLWLPVRHWVPTEWAPLWDAADRIEKYVGDWNFGLDELHRLLLLRAGGLRSGAVLQPREGPELRVTLKPAFWSELKLTGFVSDRSLYVDGTLAGEKLRQGQMLRLFKALHLFVSRADLDKHYPRVREAVAAPAPPPPHPEPPPRVPPGPEPKDDWKAKVEKYLSDRALRGEKIPKAPQMLEICGRKLNVSPNLRDMQQLLRNWRLSHK